LKFKFQCQTPHKNGKNCPYQIILQDNLQRLANFILEKKQEFDFVIPKMKLNGNDILELRDFFLNMTPEERKRSGINKSTLWYMKKNLSERNMSKMYEKTLLKIQ